MTPRGARFRLRRVARIAAWGAGSLAAAAAGAAAAVDVATRVSGTPGDDGAPWVTYAPTPRAIELRASAGGAEAGVLVLGGVARPVRIDADGPGGVPTLVADLGGDSGGQATVAGRWIEGSGDARAVEIVGVVAYSLGGADATPYRVRLEYEREAGADRGVLTADAAEWRTGTVVLGGRSFRYALRDRDCDGDFSAAAGLDLVLDRDGDGRFDAEGEAFDGGERFDVGTGAWRLRSVSADGRRVEFARSLLPAASRPFLGRGDALPPLPAEDLDGVPVPRPGLRGRRTLLVFWASW